MFRCSSHAEQALLSTQTTNSLACDVAIASPLYSRWLILNSSSQWYSGSRDQARRKAFFRSLTIFLDSWFFGAGAAQAAFAMSWPSRDALLADRRRIGWDVHPRATALTRRV